MSQQEVIELFINRIIYPFNNVHAPCLQIPMYFYGVRIVTKDLVNYIHSLEKKIHVWTINDENEINSLIDWNVDGIMTDRPAKLKEILIKKSLWPH
jgi:glycerophosphoryl diester phosphodiesterase